MKSRRAFTLIELLVVVAIIALLMSILLPTLTRAREQARTSKCLANMRSIVQAAFAYYTAEKNLVFCWPQNYRVGNESATRPYGYYTEFIWGGGIPDGKQGDWDDTQGSSSIGQGGADTMWYTARERPLNHFLVPGVSFDQPGRLRTDAAGSQNANRVATPMDLPDVFKCPSDSTAAVPFAGGAPDPTRELDSPIRTWTFWGTSYPINWYWGYFYGGSSAIVNTIAGNAATKLQPISPKMLRQKADRGAAEWIVFYENLMNYNLESAQPRGFPNGAVAKTSPGWHKQPNYHVAAFFDGHSSYRHFDTRFIDGPGWTTWPNRPWDDSPTYKPYEDN